MESEFQYYEKNNTNYVADGNVAIKPSSSKLKIELNGMCEIQLIHPYDKEGRWKILSLEDGVIKAPTPWSEGQLFVIYNTEKKITGIEVSAYHIFWDLNYSKILDRRAELKNGQQALNILLQGTKYTGNSDITTVNTCYWVDTNRIAAINGTQDNTFIKRWGGEIALDNFNVTINDHIGGDYGAFVSYGVNMQDLGLKRDMTGIVTRVYPKAYNGYTLPEKYVDSPLINSYRIIKEGDLDCRDLKLQEDCSEGETGYRDLNSLYEAMRKKVQEAFSKGLDKPKVSGTCKVAPLENTTKYEKVKGLVNIGLGDTVSVTHEDIDINSTTRCVGYTWNQITRKYEEVTLGEIETTSFDKASDATNKINNILNKDGSVNALSISGIINAVQAKFKAMRNISEKQHVRAMLFEDRVKGSPTYGAMCLGSMGFEIASERTPDDKDWNWRTFGTGKGFIADEIVAGVLTSILIQNADGSFKIDLSGTGGCEFYNDNKLSIRIKNNIMDFFASGNTNVNIGSLGSTRASKNGAWDPDGLPYIEMWHNPDDSVIAIGYRDKKDKTIPPYIRFDKSLKYNKSAPIAIDESVCMGDYFDMNGWKFLVDKEKYPDLYLTSSTKGWLWCNGGFVASGDIECKGNKKCIQETKNFGDVSFYATEDMDSYLTYTSSLGDKYKCKETEYMSEYKCIIKIPKIVKETINTNLEYRVYINKLSFGDYKIKTYPSYFVVTSDKPLIFQYYIRGIRKGFENELLKNNMKKYEDKLKNRSKTLYTYKQSRKAANEWINNGECYEG